MILREILLTEEKRPEINKDCVQLIEDEVKKKKGISGAMVKTGFKVVKTFKKGFLPKVVRELLPEFCDALDPMHEEWQGQAANGSFGEYMKERDERVAAALLEVTDEKAENADAKTIKKFYYKMRASAERNVQQAVPGLADLMDKYYQ